MQLAESVDPVVQLPLLKYSMLLVTPKGLDVNERAPISFSWSLEISSLFMRIILLSKNKNISSRGFALF